MPINILLTKTTDKTDKFTLHLTIDGRHTPLTTDMLSKYLTDKPSDYSLESAYRSFRALMHASNKSYTIKTNKLLRALFLTINDALHGDSQAKIPDPIELTVELSEPKINGFSCTINLSGKNWNNYVSEATTSISQAKIVDRSKTVNSVVSNFIGFALLAPASAVGFTIGMPFLITLIGGSLSGGSLLLIAGMCCIIAGLAAFGTLVVGIASACKLRKIDNDLFKKKEEPVVGVLVAGPQEGTQ